MISARHAARGEETAIKIRYYILSLKTTAAKHLAIVWGHWSVENDLHWTLDIAFREDDGRVGVGHGDENLAILRHVALNLLKQEKTAKVGIKAKLLKTAWMKTTCFVSWPRPKMRLPYRRSL